MKDTKSLTSNPEQRSRIAQLEELRQLIKIALMNGDLGDKEHLVLSRKAEAIGLDSDVFELQLSALVGLKDKACRRGLFRKRNTEEYFEDSEGLDLAEGYDADFNKLFLSNEERVLWSKMRNQQAADEMSSIMEGYSDIIRGLSGMAGEGSRSMKVMAEMSKFSREISENLDDSE